MRLCSWDRKEEITLIVSSLIDLGLTHVSKLIQNLGLTNVSKRIDLSLTDVINHKVSCNSLLAVFFRPNIYTYMRYIWSMAQNYLMCILKFSLKSGQQKEVKMLYILHTNQATSDIDNFKNNLILNSTFNICIEQFKFSRLNVLANMERRIYRKLTQKILTIMLS